MEGNRDTVNRDSQPWLVERGAQLDTPKESSESTCVDLPPVRAIMCFYKSHLKISGDAILMDQDA